MQNKPINYYSFIMLEKNEFKIILLTTILLYHLKIILNNFNKNYGENNVLFFN